MFRKSWEIILRHLGRSTKSEKVYPSMLQRNEEGELNNFSNQTLDNGADPSSTHRYAGSSTSRSSVGNYSALLSLSRMNSKEEDCEFFLLCVSHANNVLT